MVKEYVKPTKKIQTRNEMEDGANVATRVEEYECFCGEGTIEYCVVPGFDDDYFVIKCQKCKQKIGFIEWSGSDWAIYLYK